jgi:hypothetical protein
MKFYLADWGTMCSPKTQGGLGVLNLKCMNEALLAKWLWNFENSDGLWQKSLEKKIVKGTPLIPVKRRQNDSLLERSS